MRFQLAGIAGAFMLLSAVAPSVSAQRATPTTLTPLPRLNVISVNPFGPIFEMFTAEYERKLNNSVTLGVSGTYWTRKLDDELRQNSLNARVRFYPFEHAPGGLSIGVSMGMTRIRGVSDSCLPGDPCPKESTTNPTFGVEAAHNWIMGPSQRFVLGTGIGVRRLFGDVAGDTRVLPAFRMNIGYAF